MLYRGLGTSLRYLPDLEVSGFLRQVNRVTNVHVWAGQVRDTKDQTPLESRFQDLVVRSINPIPNVLFTLRWENLDYPTRTFLG